jgi:carbon-monoxide dehydrogenase medium subunit
MPQMTVSSGEVRLGALCRHRDVEFAASRGTTVAFLAEAEAYVGHASIRNRGTVVGSLVHADPTAEMPLMAVLLDAYLLARSVRGTRAIDARAFYRGYFETALESDELVLEAVFPALSTDACWAFAEVSARHGDFALASAACVIEFDDSGRSQSVRIAVNGIAGASTRLPATENVLSGRELEASHLGVLSTVALREILDNPIATDASAYQQHVAAALVESVVTRAVTRRREAHQ